MPDLQGAAQAPPNRAERRRLRSQRLKAARRAAGRFGIYDKPDFSSVEAYGALHMLPPSLRCAALEFISNQSVKILEAEGIAGLEIPREEAAAHEAGHAVVAQHEGYAIERIIVAEKFWSVAGRPVTVWTGFTYLGGPRTLVVGPRTDPGNDLSYARVLIAGLVGEEIAGLARDASSIDELIMSQAVVSVAAGKLGVDGEALWASAVWRRTAKIIRHNIQPLNQITGHLLYAEEIDGAVLKQMLSEVRRLPAESNR